MTTIHTNDILLPEKPSELIMLALKDLVKVRDLPGYRIDMDYWHKPFKILPICKVCYAGAVMANTLKVPKYKGKAPSDFTEDTCAKLIMLDMFRKGKIEFGLFLIGINVSYPNIYPLNTTMILKVF